MYLAVVFVMTCSHSDSEYRPRISFTLNLFFSHFAATALFLCFDAVIAPNGPFGDDV